MCSRHNGAAGRAFPRGRPAKALPSRQPVVRRAAGSSNFNQRDARRPDAVDNSVKLEGQSTRPGVYKCRECRKQFSVTVGTVFERSHVPLNKWLLATHLLAASKKGMSSHQLGRMLDVTYRTAWFMAHRIREAMTPTTTPPMGGDGGVVEADETYIGREPGAPKARRAFHHKMKVLSLIDRNTGAARSVVVKDVNSKSVTAHMAANVAADSRLMTDEAPYYRPFGSTVVAEVCRPGSLALVRGGASVSPLTFGFVGVASIRRSTSSRS